MPSEYYPLSGNTYSVELTTVSFVDLETQSAVKIQGAFRKHQARLKLDEQAAWDINEKLEYTEEQTEAKVCK